MDYVFARSQNSLDHAAEMNAFCCRLLNTEHTGKRNLWQSAKGHATRAGPEGWMEVANGGAEGKVWGEGRGD